MSTPSVPGALPLEVGWLTFGDPGEAPWSTRQEWSCSECGAYDVPGELVACSRPAPQAWATPGVALPTRPAALVGALSDAMDAVEVAGPLSGSRTDTAALLALAERARALALRELAEMDAVGGHAVAGRAGTTASWLRRERQLTDTSARATVHLARRLRDDLPAVAAVLLRGRTTAEHAMAVAAGVRGLDPAVVRDAGDGLAALVQATDPVEVRRRLRDMAVAVDDRLGAEAERRARERMGLRVAEVGAHTAIDGTLAGQDGATVRLAMELAVEQGRTAGDTRGRSARQADVLVGWAADYLHREHGPGDSTAQDAHTVRTHLLVTCTPQHLAATQAQPQAEFAQLLDRDRTGAESAAAHLAGSSTPLSRGALRRLACDATLDLVVLRSAHDAADPLYVGRATRTVTGAQFRALVVRDRTCVVAGCHRPPAGCIAHHVQHWADGGGTDLDNLVLLCHQHHHDHHDRGLDLPHQDGRRQLTPTGWAQVPP